MAVPPAKDLSTKEFECELEFRALSRNHLITAYLPEFPPKAEVHWENDPKEEDTVFPVGRAEAQRTE
jgi:hypothetical protein